MWKLKKMQKAIRCITYRGEVYKQLPERFIARPRVHVPQGIVHSSGCNVNDTLLRTNPRSRIILGCDRGSLTGFYHLSWGSAIK